MLNVYIKKVPDVYKKCTMFMKKVDIKIYMFKKMLIMYFQNVKHVHKKYSCCIQKMYNMYGKNRHKQNKFSKMLIIYLKNVKRVYKKYS